MIKRLKVKNFRSIQNLDIELSSINAFIGPNNAGKSNIMKALNLILGETYPTNRSFTEKDFFNYDNSRKIEIEVHFQNPINIDTLQVFGFKLEFDGNQCNYLAIDQTGKVLTYSSGREVKVSNKMKEESILMYIGLDRQASQQIKPSRWTIYGKLLNYLAKAIPNDKTEYFRRTIENEYKNKIYPSLRDFEDTLKEYVKEQVGFDLHLKLSMLDPLEILRDLRPYFREVGNRQEFDAEDMGAGTQSALSIALARVYSEIIRKPLIVAIEEPELYLHPHGCRHFYRLLKDISNKGVQIIYTTHEKAFVDILNFQSVYIVRKEGGETRVYSGINKNISEKDAIKYATKFDESINEVFFANKVILVEGPDDKIACSFALERLKVEIDKLGISIIECGSNTNVKPIAEILRFFKIPTYVLIDEDPGNPNSSKVITNIRNMLGSDFVLLQSPNLEGIFSLDKKLSKREAVEFFSKFFTDKNNKVPEVYVKLKKKILP